MVVAEVMGDPREVVTIGVSPYLLSWSSTVLVHDDWIILGYPHLGHPHLAIYIQFIYYIPLHTMILVTK